MVVDQEDADHGCILLRRTNTDRNFRARPAPADAGAVDAPGVRVLVVDGSARLRQRLAVRLAERGLLVVGEAGTAAAALTAAVSLRPDAVVTDVLLRDRHRLELVGALRAALPDALLVVLTNAASYREHCLSRGADCFLDKSAAFDNVAELLRRRAVARA